MGSPTKGTSLIASINLGPQPFETQRRQVISSPLIDEIARALFQAIQSIFFRCARQIKSDAGGFAGLIADTDDATVSLRKSMD